MNKAEAKPENRLERKIMSKIKTKHIDDSAITLAKQADMATASLVYRKTAGAGAPEVNTLAQLKTDLDITRDSLGVDTDDTVVFGGVTLGDGAEAIFGADSDIKILHTGTYNQIRSSSALYLHNGDASEILASFTPDGAANLYHNNVKRIETTNTGVTVTGNIVIDGTVDGVDLETVTRQDVNITASASEFTPVFTNHDVVMDFITAQAAAITFNAPTDDAAGDRYFIELTDNATSRAITYNAAYKFGMTNITKPENTTVSKALRMLFISDGTNLNCLAADVDE